MTGDPSFDLFKASYPYASRKALDSFGLDELVGLSQLLHEHAGAVVSARPAVAAGGRSSWGLYNWVPSLWPSSSMAWLLGSRQPARS